MINLDYLCDWAFALLLIVASALAVTAVVGIIVWCIKEIVEDIETLFRK